MKAVKFSLNKKNVGIFLSALSLTFLACSDEQKKQEIKTIQSENIQLKGAIERAKEAVKTAEDSSLSKENELKRLDFMP